MAESIREQIVSGELGFGQQLPSQKQLAIQYNVSLITVKRAILELVKEGFLRGHPGKGVFVGSPISHAHASPQTQTKSIGALITDLTSPFYSSVLRAVEIEASHENYFVILSNTDTLVPNEPKQIERLLAAGVGGIVVASRAHQNQLQPHLQKLLESGMPLVFVSYCDDHRVNYIGTDNRLGGYMATKHLISLGHRQIAFVTPDKNNSLGNYRYAGYLDALKEAGLEKNEKLIVSIDEYTGENRFHGGYRIGKEMLAEGKLPDAIFAFSDLTALGLKRAFLENNLRIPQDIALVGFDDIPMARQSLVPLTTIRQPFEQIGQLAFDTLKRKMNGEKSVTRLSLMPELIVRKSCGAQEEQQVTINRHE